MRIGRPMWKLRSEFQSLGNKWKQWKTNTERSHKFYSDHPNLVHLFAQLSITFWRVIQKEIKAKPYTQYTSHLSNLLHASDFPKSSKEEVSPLTTQGSWNYSKALGIQDSLLTNNTAIPLHWFINIYIYIYIFQKY